MERKSFVPSNKFHVSIDISFNVPQIKFKADYECVKGPAGRWECSSDCPSGAGKRRMNCECSKRKGCKWNDFEGWCIKDETTTSTQTSTTKTTSTNSTTTKVNHETTSNTEIETTEAQKTSKIEVQIAAETAHTTEHPFEQQKTTEEPETIKSVALISETSGEETTTINSITTINKQTSLDKKPVHFTFEIFDLNAACPTDIGKIKFYS